MLPRKVKPAFFDILSNVPGRYIKPEPVGKAKGQIAEIYGQIEEEFFINGPTTTHAVSPPLLAGVWMAEREIMLTDDRLTREDKEALGVTFSQINGCTYCEDLINSTVYGAGEGQLAEDLRFRRQEKIGDLRTRLFHQWALSTYSRDSVFLENPPFTIDEAPEVIGCALMFNYFNRYVKVFFNGTPLKAPFSSRLIKSALYRLTGFELRESVVRRLQPGRANRFLPEAPLGEEFSWARPNANIADAIARWSAALDEASGKVIPPRVAARMELVVGQWRGETMPVSRSWLNVHMTDLDARERAALSLALLTALSPSQISDSVIDEFRAHFESDENLVVTVAWAAFAAAKQIAGWLAAEGGFMDEARFATAAGSA